ncbi:hypothetical protein [Inquilinus sp. CAU 1745]|uniref:anti-sigma factor family protein n=1 Tax=Inquilinus sp. CAU 1745 TaxID=3140369 RepID=UPI00325AD410
MTTSSTITELDLQAFTDDLLDPSRRSEVASYLRDNPEQAERVEIFQAHRAAIRETYMAAFHEEIPKRLLTPLERPDRSFRRSVAPAAVKMAAAIALTVTAGYGGWWLRGEPEIPPSPMTMFLTDAATGQMAPVALAASPAAPVPTGSTPDLGALGYEMVGRTVHNGSIGQIERLYYEGPNGPVVLQRGHLHQGLADPRPFASPQGGGLYWVDGSYAYALTGPGAMLGQLSTVIQAQSPSMTEAAGRQSLAVPDGSTAAPAAVSPGLEVLPAPTMEVDHL